MKRYVHVLTVMLFSFTLTGCDAVKSFFGMPTSAEIEKMKEAELQKARRAAFIADSIEQARRDSVAAAEAVQEKLPGRYMVVVGSFRVNDNVDRMMERLKRDGYEPVAMQFSNGFGVVSAFDSDNYGEALREKRLMMEKEYCPEDIWIYDRIQDLEMK